MRVVSELVAPFARLNYVVYCDNYYSSAPLVDKIAKDKVFFVETIKRCAKGCPDSLNCPEPPAPWIPSLLLVPRLLWI